MNDHLRVPSAPIPLLHGPAFVTQGYFELEDASRGNAAFTMQEHDFEVRLWYRALTLHLVAVKGHWPSTTIDDAPGRRKAKSAQTDLLGLGLSSSKAALDMILASFYSMAWAAIRHCLESSVHFYYLEDFPESSEVWYGDSGEEDTKPPSCSQMCDQIRKKYKDADDWVTRTHVENIEGSYRVWHLMSKGAHPTGQGLVQLQDLDRPGPRWYGSNYRYDLTMLSFDNGFYALSALLQCFYLAKPLGIEWSELFRDWNDDVHGWRSQLKTNERVLHLSKQIMGGSS